MSRCRCHGLHAAALGLCLGLAQCDSEPDVPPPIRSVQTLVSASAWQAVGPDDDAFAERIVVGGRCEAGEGHFREDFANTAAYKVDTTVCDGVTLSQPTLVDIRADEVIDLKVFHFTLLADDPAEAMLGLALDGDRLWETRVAIPAQAALIETVIELDRDYAAGVPIQFHVDNHGDNNWVLFRVEREPG